MDRIANEYQMASVWLHAGGRTYYPYTLLGHTKITFPFFEAVLKPGLTSKNIVPRLM